MGPSVPGGAWLLSRRQRLGVHLIRSTLTCATHLCAAGALLTPDSDIRADWPSYTRCSQLGTHRFLWDDAPRHLAVSDHPDPPSLSAEGQAPELAEVVAGHHQQVAVHLLVVQLEADAGATAISAEWVLGVSEATVQ